MAIAQTANGFAMAMPRTTAVVTVMGTATITTIKARAAKKIQRMTIRTFWVNVLQEKNLEG